VPKPYPSEFRDDVVRVVGSRESGVTIEQIAKDFGVHPMERTYHRRRRQAALGRLTPIEFEAIMNTQAALAALLQTVTYPCSRPRRRADSPGDHRCRRHPSRVFREERTACVPRRGSNPAAHYHVRQGGTKTNAPDLDGPGALVFSARPLAPELPPRKLPSSVKVLGEITKE
jgi:transposase-like protein